jgi:hypothetical protein
MDRFLRRAVFFLVLLGVAMPAPAMDPILMFVLSVAREMIERNAAGPGTATPLPHLGPRAADLPDVYPGTMVQPAHLRRLIDDCFFYLSEDRRGEIFESLHAGLLDPKNAPMRASLIDHFTEKAFAVRAAQLRLQKMSPREKEFLAGEFRKEIATLPPEEQARVAGLLREGLLPVPDDFSRMLLGAVENRQ